MKKHTKILIYIGISSLVVAILFFFLWITGVSRVFTLKPRLDNLLYHTDHQALLAACRSLMKEGYKGKYQIVWPDKHPDTEKFPKEILALKPSFITVYEGRMFIEMLGGQSFYGVVAYAEDFKEQGKGFHYGNKKLIDGLWFYSDFIDLNE
jgi:hypothetical protein